LTNLPKRVTITNLVWRATAAATNCGLAVSGVAADWNPFACEWEMDLRLDPQPTHAQARAVFRVLGLQDEPLVREFRATVEPFDLLRVGNVAIYCEPLEDSIQPTYS